MNAYRGRPAIPPSCQPIMNYFKAVNLYNAHLMLCFLKYNIINHEFSAHKINILYYSKHRNKLKDSGLLSSKGPQVQRSCVRWMIWQGAMAITPDS